MKSTSPWTFASQLRELVSSFCAMKHIYVMNVVESGAEEVFGKQHSFCSSSTRHSIMFQGDVAFFNNPLAFVAGPKQLNHK